MLGERYKILLLCLFKKNTFILKKIVGEWTGALCLVSLKKKSFIMTYMSDYFPCRHTPGTPPPSTHTHLTLTQEAMLCRQILMTRLDIHLAVRGGPQGIPQSLTQPTLTAPIILQIGNVTCKMNSPSEPPLARSPNLPESNPSQGAVCLSSAGYVSHSILPGGLGHGTRSWD